MGETAEFEKLNTLEARLAAALDRIAAGIGTMPAHPPLEDPGLSSAAAEDALIRAEAAEARMAALEAQMAGMIDAAEAVAAAQAAAATLAARDAEIARLHAMIAQSDSAPATMATDTAEHAARIAALESTLATLSQDRDAALAAARAAQDEMARLHTQQAALPEGGGADLRAEIASLLSSNAQLVETIAKLRREGAGDPSLREASLAAELDALRTLRSSEAAELHRILADLEGGMSASAATQGGAHA
ncbi:hypothetical protein LSUCC0031_06340 [Rhodobacterales bacterium LSUCC0031]|nr:hypothetical protein [Rhodobacterales bacterium LSUCC0031]